MADNSGELTVQELQDSFNEEDSKVEAPDREEREEREDEREDEHEEGTEETETKEGEEDRGTTGKDEEDAKERVQYKEITTKYPNFFKDFPQLRHTFFQSEQYRELFPSVDDAREAREDVDGIRELEEALISGGEGDIAGVLDAITELGEDVMPNFSLSFLPALKKVDQDTYYQAVTPIFVDLVRDIYGAGVSNDNENLRNTALVVSQYLFRNQKIATGEQNIDSPRRQKPDTSGADQIEQERQSFRQEKYVSLYNDVVHDSDSQLRSLILDGLDNNNNMSGAMQDLIADKVVKEVSNTLSSSNSHRNRMDALWKKAGDANFATGNKSRIVGAYLAAAKEIMPRIRSKIKSSVLGIRDRQPSNDVKYERREPREVTGGGSRQSFGNNGKSAKDVDWRKTSDADFLKGNITYRKR